jgi:hypothetical protein
MTVVPPAPTPLVQGLAYRYSIQPSLKGTTAPETANSSKYAEEDFLGHIGGVRCVVKDSVYEVIDWSVVVGDKPFERGVGARLQLRDKIRFVMAPR